MIKLIRDLLQPNEVHPNGLSDCQGPNTELVRNARPLVTANNPSPSLPIPVGLNFLFLNFDNKI